MQRDVFWIPWEGVGLESLTVSHNQQGVRAQSMVIGMQEGKPFRLMYELECDRLWKLRSATLHLLNTHHSIKLLTDGAGNWQDESGNPLSSLSGCYEIDISVTPFTNTLPIRRLKLNPGESYELKMVYIAVPGMTVLPVRQRYTCLQSSPEGGVYRYEGPIGKFKVDLPVDADGLVLDYPELFTRVTV